MGVLFQIIATGLLCFSCMNMAIIFTWPSSTILLFKSENTTLNRPMTDTDVALFGSLSSVGALVCLPVTGLVLDRLGRKRTTLLSSLITVIAWSIIALTDQVEIVLTTMVIFGLGCGIFLQCTIYVSEIAQDSIRGTLTAGPNLSCSFGALVSYFLGGALGYHAMVYTCLLLAVAGVLMIAVLKESPLTLMAKGREEEAANSIAFYRRTKTTSMEVITELNNIRRSLKPDSDDVQSLTREKNNMESESEVKKKSCWQFFKSSPSTRRQFYLVMVLKTSNICQGLPMIQVYAEPIFEAAIGDYISPNLCSVTLGLVTLICGLVAGYLTDVFGRRPLTTYSAVAAAICCAVLGTHIVTELLPKWMTPLLVYIYAISYTFGVGTTSYVVSTEILLPEVKSIILALALEWYYTCQFAVFFLFNLLIPLYGLAPMFFFFSFYCFVSFIYFFYFLPETKGLPVYAIHELFKKNTRK